MLGKGVYLWVGEIFPLEGPYATSNRITGVTIDANRITTGTAGQGTRTIKPRAASCSWEGRATAVAD